MNENFMKEKPVFPLLISMALPMVISMLVNSLYNIVDSFFVAQISEDAMTALSLVYPVQNFVNAVAIGFGIGLNAVISYYLGAGDKKAAGCAATQGLALTMLHAVILTIGSLLVIERFLRMFSSSETVIDLGVRYGILAVYSQSYVVVLGIYYKLQTFIYLTANGIVQGMRPIIGFNYGAGEHKRVRKIYEITLIMCAVIMLIGTGICLAIPEQLIGLFSSNPETIRLGGQALTRISAGFLISAVSITSSGALEGLGKGGSSLIISLCRNVIIILPAAYLLSHLGGGVFVWHAFWITEVISAAVSLVVYRRAVRR